MAALQLGLLEQIDQADQEARREDGEGQAHEEDVDQGPRVFGGPGAEEEVPLPNLRQEEEDQHHDGADDVVERARIVGDLAEPLRRAIDRTLNHDCIRTRDLGGSASTKEFGDALIRNVS